MVSLSGDGDRAPGLSHGGVAPCSAQKPADPIARANHLVCIPVWIGAAAHPEVRPQTDLRRVISPGRLRFWELRVDVARDLSGE
jgi:hypothetical protein